MQATTRNLLVETTTAVDEIVRVGRLVSARGWVPATSGNFSVRVDARRMAISGSGVDKGALTPHDVLLMDLDGEAPPGSSAETPLHAALYRRDPSIGAVLHTHSVPVTVVSRAYADSASVTFSDYEILKAFRGVATHETSVRVPLVENTQDLEGLAERLGSLVDACPGLVLSGHGLYAWGRDVPEAVRHLEALEFLFACELERGRYQP